MVDGTVEWRLWGPYLSERQWGTVREDSSEGGNAWAYLSHDQARSRAYRWGEDGLAGISDEQQRLCLALALWNGRDPILKERLFGLTNNEGNHGEDVKEVYYYVDATPTHSYLKMLYKYPQGAFPYEWLVAENRRRSRQQPEFELLDTGIFDENRYFDVFVEYAKASPEDVLMQITVWNRGLDAVPLHVLPQLWYRNTWSWGYDPSQPELRVTSTHSLVAQHATLGEYHFYADENPSLLFCGNETDTLKLFGFANGKSSYKDAFHRAIVQADPSVLNRDGAGTKAAAHYQFLVPAGEQRVIRARLCRHDLFAPFLEFDQVMKTRRKDADQFYASLHHGGQDQDSRQVQRQAYAGLIWSKQFYYYDVPQWLKGDPAHPPPPTLRTKGRNRDWTHLNNADVISMPDKWEYPWYAAWDLAFHAVAFASLDADFAKQQLVLMTREWYMHPNGQLPAYEWSFGDVNPPVHGWAAWRVFQIDRKRQRAERPGYEGDLDFLERIFHKLMLNFTWWVNRKDAAGRNTFQGGFLGLDNVGIFDRSAPFPGGGQINQADATSWMAMYSLNLMRIALELAQRNHVYEDIATKFFEHFLTIAQAMTDIGETGLGLWNEEDGFFYDVLELPHGEAIPLKIRSVVGLIPLFAVETLEPDLLQSVPEFKRRLEWFLNYRPDLAALVSRWDVMGQGERRLLSLLRGHRMKLLLRRMLDESEFLSEHGVRSVSRYHARHSYTFQLQDEALSLNYQPGESTSNLFGGNSNWRGPIWFPINYLLIESLQKFHHYYGGDFNIECPTGSGRYLTIDGVAKELSSRLVRLFLRNEKGERPACPSEGHLAGDKQFSDYIHFYEYFHGDSGRGLGASHQTGWTGLVAKLLQCHSTR